MAETILFVFEGERTEPNIFSWLQPHFFSAGKHPPIIHACFGAEIYQLLKQLEVDPFLDLVEILRERGADLPAGLERESVSQIFLFFDYDPHTSLADDPKLDSALKLFCEETDAGKLYISYPMVEALRDVADEFETATVSFDNLPDYKQTVNERNPRLHLRNLDSKGWKELFKLHPKKGNKITGNPFAFTASAPSQPEIFSAQQKTYFPENKIAVLGGIPFFIFEYFGTPLFNEE